MEEMMLPFCMRRNSGIGDVIIPSRKEGIIIFENTSLYPPSSSRNAVLKFRSGGTGFLIAIVEIIFKGVKEDFGILLTAAHVVKNLTNMNQNCKAFIVEDDNYKYKLYKYKAYIIEDFVSQTSEEYISPSKNFRYCLPGDVCILLIRLISKRGLEVYEKAETISINEKCFVSGFPMKPSKMAYALPCLNCNSTREVEDKVNEIFLGFGEQLVYSSGNVVDKSMNIVEISCSTTNGMSGSPIIQNGKYIGVYVGGPALPGQRELVQIIQNIQCEDFDSVISDIQSIQLYNSLYEREIFSCLKTFTNENSLLSIISDKRQGRPVNNEREQIYLSYELHQLKKEKLMDKIKDLCFNLIYKTVCKYNDRANFRSNTGISSESSVFDRISVIVGKFYSLRGRSFTDIQGLVTEIRNN